MQGVIWRSAGAPTKALGWIIANLPRPSHENHGACRAKARAFGPHGAAVAVALLASLLGGCSLMEPTARNQFSVKPGTSAEAVFHCAEEAIRSLNLRQGNWRDNVTTRDTRAGLFETGRFGEFNIVGIRTQIRYVPSTGSGRIHVKASGPYFVDLGAEQAAAQLAKEIVQCP